MKSQHVSRSFVLLLFSERKPQASRPPHPKPFLVSLSGIEIRLSRDHGDMAEAVDKSDESNRANAKIKGGKGKKNISSSGSRTPAVPRHPWTSYH